MDLRFIRNTEREIEGIWGSPCNQNSAYAVKFLKGSPRKNLLQRLERLDPEKKAKPKLNSLGKLFKNTTISDNVQELSYERSLSKLELSVNFLPLKLN